MDARHDGPLLPKEEQQLMEGLLAGNEDAIRTIYGRFGRPVYGLGLRLLGSREAAEELTQDVFLMAWRKAARFDPARGRLSTWLMTIAHNLAVDRLRRDTGVSRPTLVLVDAHRTCVGWYDGAFLLSLENENVDARLGRLERFESRRRLITHTSCIEKYWLPWKIVTLIAACCRT